MKKIMRLGVRCSYGALELGMVSQGYCMGLGYFALAWLVCAGVSYNYIPSSIIVNKQHAQVNNDEKYLTFSHVVSEFYTQRLFLFKI